MQTINISQDEFDIWVPLEKGQKDTYKGKPVYMINGQASTEEPDLQNERVMQDGLDLEPLLSDGYINWDHMTGPENLIGEPTKAIVKSGPVLYIEGFLYPEVPRAKAVAALLESQDKEEFSKRRLGWSLQGRISQRAGNRVVKSVVQHLAITHQPVNTNTWAELVKSMSSGSAVMTTVNAAPLRLQNLDTGLTNMLFESCENGCHKDGIFNNGRSGAFNHLVKCKGATEQQAYEFLTMLHRIFQH